MKTPKAFHFVFGFHMHWTGMVWEWGIDTLSNSIQCLKKTLEETGLKAGLNLDGKGIEKLAIHDPEAIEWLKDSLSRGILEIWGGTYTQPYGILTGAESNIQQFLFGIRAMKKALGDTPKIFSEEEIHFFPQLPQILKQLGYVGALLFPQHTWTTPTFPKEKEAMIRWKGIDGSEIYAIPYSERCLMRGIPTIERTLRNVIANEPDEPLMITWLEILDRPDWMWRTEYVLPYLKDMLREKDFITKPQLLEEFFEKHRTEKSIPAREYTLDETFHGVSVGKNGDILPKLWRQAERTITRAEYLAAWCSFLGQPYPQFSSYPEWQLHEGWKNLLCSQGHDAFECQGLTDHVGRRFAQTAIMLSQDIIRRCGKRLDEVFGKRQSEPTPREYEEDAEHLFIKNANSKTTISLKTGEIIEMELEGFSFLSEPFGLPTNAKSTASPRVIKRAEGLFVISEFVIPCGGGVLKWHISHENEFLRGQIMLQFQEKPKTGILESVFLALRPSFSVRAWKVDTPFAVVHLHPNGEWLHRQPTGHWLTSPQIEERIPRPLVHQSFVFLQGERGGIQYVSAQNSLALAKENGMDEVLYNVDAWDGENWLSQATLDFALIPHLHNVSNRKLLECAELALGWHPLGKETRGKNFLVSILEGNAFLSAVRKVGEELEIRLFETEGKGGKIHLLFPWKMEIARAVSPLGDDFDKSLEIEKSSIRFSLSPYEILTLRLLFEGKRTEYFDIDSYRNIWVG